MNDMMKKLSAAVSDAGEGCLSGLVYVQPTKAVEAVLNILIEEGELDWCCPNEDRDINGACRNCGIPCF